VRRKLGWSDEVRPGLARATSWTAAVLVIFFSLNGPLHEWADGYLFTAHMVQHLLLMLLMPPC
jgi:putative membrane protein